MVRLFGGSGVPWFAAPACYEVGGAGISLPLGLPCTLWEAIRPCQALSVFDAMRRQGYRHSTANRILPFGEREGKAQRGMQGKR